MALRTFIGSCATLTSSVVNLTVLMVLNGEPGWICLMCCNADSKLRSSAFRSSQLTFQSSSRFLFSIGSRASTGPRPTATTPTSATTATRLAQSMFTCRGTRCPWPMSALQTVKCPMSIRRAKRKGIVCDCTINVPRIIRVAGMRRQASRRSAAPEVASLTPRILPWTASLS